MTLGEGSGLVAVVAPLALGGTYNLQFFFFIFIYMVEKHHGQH